MDSVGCGDQTYAEGIPLYTRTRRLARAGSAIPEYVYCCLYNCDLVPYNECPGGGWSSFDACNWHCQ
jgi:hypothetical protein